MDTIVSILKEYPLAKYVVGLALYVGYVRSQRYKRIRSLQAKYADPTLPLRNYEVAREITSSINNFEFPYLNTVSLEFALFKTYAIPSISAILHATKQFTTDCLKRAEDTAFLLLEINEGHGRNLGRCMREKKVDEAEVENDEKRRVAAIERVNFLHSQYNIKQGDYLYTLALFVLEPAAWIDQFEWRPMTQLEKNALLCIWTKQGREMGIQNIPETLEELEAWSEAYEAEHSRFAKSNVAIAHATIDLLLSNAPKSLHPFGYKVVSCLLTDRLRVAFGLPQPPRGLTTVVRGALYLRAFFIRNFMLPRRYPLVRTALRANEQGGYVPQYNKWTPLYPQGYKIEELGPKKFVGKGPGCPVAHVMRFEMETV
ncbi:hypothetical protein BGZ73_003407 [Actinomortierella ambigua]|nr:hypothetical protein BGZ73_003407 [Actinomortierella ambigua]